MPQSDGIERAGTLFRNVKLLATTSIVELYRNYSERQIYV